MLYSLDNSNESQPSQKSYTTSNHKNNSFNSTIALNQGALFNKYQNNIFKRNEKNIYKVNTKEGFTSMDTANTTDTTDNTNFTEQSNSVLDSVKITETDIQNKINLKKEYNIVLKKYKQKLHEVNRGIKDYMKRVNPNNPFLNSNIRFSTGELAYVTNQGVVKLIPSPKILQRLLNCPRKKVVNASIPWLAEYNTPGTKIPTTPPLISGTKMVSGETCGNEGNNVYVDKLVTNPSTNFKGCYGDNKSDHVMTFIGGLPPSDNYIVNGNFEQPALSNNTWNYYLSSSAVPSWDFNNGVILNNSNAWGYPKPYPNGSQCACVQQTASISQTINFSSGTYTLKFIATGRDKSNPVDIQLNGTTFYSVTPPVYVWTNYSTTFNVTTSGNNTITFLGTTSDSDKSTAFQGISISGESTNNSGTYSYEMCKNAAFDNGSQYFGLQSVNSETGLGYCSTGNDGVKVYQYGKSFVNTEGILLWSSNTNTTGSSASLTTEGTLSVFNPSGAAIFNTPLDVSNSLVLGGYLGCYTDKSNRTMTNYYGKNKTLDECKTYAEDNKYAYYGFQNVNKSKNTGECRTSNDLSETTKYGLANSCFQNSSNETVGSVWSNAVYSTDSISSYFLILQDDGNMCIYKGSGPDDNQGWIWCSKTNGQQEKPNPTYSAELGKYGKNWMASNSTLAAGDFIASTDGSIYLIMQTDGNLVLYTSKNAPNCKRMSDENMGGGTNANALYEVSPVGVPSLLGSLGYVDADSVLYSYPSSNKGLSDTYNKHENYDSTGNDLSGKSITNSTVDNCQTICTDDTDCYGFTFQKSTNTCFPKSSSSYPISQRQMNTDYDLYARNPKLLNPPKGVPDTIVNIDSVSYNNYNNSGSQVGGPYGISNINSTQKQELEQLQTRLDQISQQLVDDTGITSTNNTTVGTQSVNNINGLQDFLNDYNTTNQKIEQIGSVDNILNDSDIKVLQENYTYLFWSILAVGTVLVTMNIAKK
jgi:hypothetical protein